VTPEEAGDITDGVELPAPRAGFNLDAIKAIIETSGKGAGADDFVPPPLVMPSPSSRAQSAPPLDADELTPTREDAPPLAGPSTVQSFTATFPRSLSTNDAGFREEGDEDEDAAGATSSVVRGTPGFASPLSAQTFDYDDETGAWAPPVPPEKDRGFGRGFGAGSTVAFGGGVSAFGGNSRSAMGRSGSGGSAFGDANGSNTPAGHVSAASLSFGDASGAITTTTNVEPDPWSFGGERKVPSNYSSNPWS
jgi:hypothetical protein